MSAPDVTPEILARLDDRIAALTVQVAKLTAAVSNRPAENRPTKVTDPKRLTAAQVVAQLGISRRTLFRLAARGLCTEIRPSGRRGRSCRVYYLPDEIEALAISEEAARELMSRKRLQKRPSR